VLHVEIADEASEKVEEEEAEEEGELARSCRIWLG
jgi:hypothetical protein